MFNVIYNIGDIPSWLSAIAALIAVIFGVVPAFNAFKKLISKTNEHEQQLEQLKNLTTSNKEQTNELSKLAQESVNQTAELKQLISLNDIALRAAKKPNIKLEIESNLNTDGITGGFTLLITNTNKNSTIIKVELSKFHGMDNVTPFTITNTEYGQLKRYKFTKENKRETLFLKLDYITEQGFKYIQDVILQVKNERVNIINESPVISKENAAL